MEERCGPWRLEQLVAVGGIGEVWRARSAAGEVAAVKRLHTHLARLREVAEQFARERALLCDLAPHPALVRGLERGEEAGRPYVAMSFAGELDLRRHLEGPDATRGQPAATTALPRPLALAIIARAASAAAHLHRAGWVHGDLVPANFVIADALPKVVLCDLGVARPLGAGGAVQGTHAYMAPEQVRGEAWSPALDVFALGVMLWELLAGRRLFHRGPPWSTMAAVMEVEAPLLGEPALDALLGEALAKEVGRRLTSAAELAERAAELAER